MTTRREFLASGAGVAAAFSGAREVLFAQDDVGSATNTEHEKLSKLEDNRPRLRLHLLGCGYPPPSGSGSQTRHGSAFLLEVGSEFLMVDCGPATTYKMARMGISTKKVNHVFLTHHHFDHNVDLPCFALVRWDLSKNSESPLSVYGPPPTRLFVEQLFGEKGAFFLDWKSRVTHPVSIRIFQNRGGKRAEALSEFNL